MNNIGAIKKAIFNELSKYKYRLTLDKCDYIIEVDTRMSWCDEKIERLFGGIKDNAVYFSMHVWNSGTLNFKCDSKWSQGKVVWGENNTDFRYYIEVDLSTFECRLGGYERKYYGFPDGYTKHEDLYHFKIDVDKFGCKDNDSSMKIKSKIYVLGFPKEKYTRRCLDGLSDKEKYSELALNDSDVCIYEDISDFQDVTLNSSSATEHLSSNWWYFVAKA